MFVSAILPEVRFLRHLPVIRGNVVWFYNIVNVEVSQELNLTLRAVRT